MEQITSTSEMQMCIKHAQKKIEFLKVNDLSNTQNDHLFYCTTCINSDLKFKGINYLLISQIIDEGETNILQKWPPLNDQSVIEKLIQISEDQDSSTSIILQIDEYFTQLKDEFLRKIDLCQKKMINRALELPLGKESILKNYQEISQIMKLRSLLIQRERLDVVKQEQACWQFISEMESQKQQSSKQLEDLLHQCSVKDQLINFEYPNLIKNSIFSFIEEIDFFHSNDIHHCQDNNNQETKQQNSSVSNIMKLISNKSNFCSSDFLAQTQGLLQKIHPILQSIQFDNMYEENKLPIDFTQLSQQRFKLIQDLVEHSIQLDQSREYSESISNAYGYQYLESLFNSRVNFMNSSLNSQLKQYLKDFYPLLQSVNFTDLMSTSEKQKFKCFSTLDNDEIEDCYQLLKIKKQLSRNNEYGLSQTKEIKEQIMHLLNDFDNAEDVFLKYPIFDLMKKKQIIDQPIELKLTKTKFQDGSSRIEIDQNHLSVCINQQDYSGLYKGEYWVNCVSNIVLERDKKYIFRFQINRERSDVFSLMFGLIRMSECDRTDGDNEKLSCHLKNVDNIIQHRGGYGIDKYLKGERLKLSEEKQIEMRVWLCGKQLEVLDFPNYEYKVGIKDEFKNKLIELDDLKLYIGLHVEQIKVTLTSAFVANNIPD